MECHDLGLNYICSLEDEIVCVLRVSSLVADREYQLGGFVLKCLVVFGVGGLNFILCLCLKSIQYARLD